MSDPKFTPGPWRVGSRGVIWTVPKEPHEPPSRVAEVVAYRPTTNHADACLVSAAPDLHDALAGLLEVTSCRTKSFVGGRGAVVAPVDGPLEGEPTKGNGPCDCCVCEAARVARAALLKAGG